MKKVLACFALISAAAGTDCPLVPPIWPATYELKATLNVPDGDIREPIHIWHDSRYGYTRIDYFEGATKVFTRIFSNSTGVQYTVKPEAIEEFGFNPCTIKSKNITQPMTLPDLSDYQFEGNEYLEGKLAQKWTKQKLFPPTGRYIKNIMWIGMKTTKNEETPIPLMFEQKGLSYHFISYHEYKKETPDPAIWEFYEKFECVTINESDYQELHPLNEYIHGHDDHIGSDYEKFVKTHNKKYANIGEYNMRKSIYARNRRIIESHNRAGHSYKLALNHLADLKENELKAYHGWFEGWTSRASPFPYDERQIEELSKDLPREFNWQLHGAVSPVKNQWKCGSCYTFASTGAIEGAYFLKTGKKVILSEQALVDCSFENLNTGCDGGHYTRCFDWVLDHGGLPLQEDYPYGAIETQCHYNDHQLYANITGYVAVPPNNENALKVALLKHGPISVSMFVQPKFPYYSSGVYYDQNCTSENLNHAVLLVGYGSIKGENYWLLKNSWGKYFGTDGYAMISTRNNTCGVMKEPVYVTMGDT